MVSRPRYRATVAVTETAGQGVFEGMPTPLYAASPSRLLAYLECPRRYRFQYLDRPRPPARPQRAHTSVGIATHNALRDWWDLPRPARTAAAGVDLVRKAWIDSGFRDDDQSGRWRSRVSGEVQRYLVQVDPDDQPRGIERTVAMRTDVARAHRPGRPHRRAPRSRRPRARDRRLQDQPAHLHRGGRPHLAAVGPVCGCRVEDVPPPDPAGRAPPRAHRHGGSAHAYRRVVAPQARRGRLARPGRTGRRRLLPPGRRGVAVVPTPAVGAVHLVRLPCCLSGGAADGAGEVLVGGPRAR